MEKRKFFGLRSQDLFLGTEIKLCVCSLLPLGHTLSFLKKENSPICKMPKWKNVWKLTISIEERNETSCRTGIFFIVKAKNFHADRNAGFTCRL